MRIKLAYGHEGLWVDIPDDVHVDVIEPQYVPGLLDESAAVRQALQKPIGTPPLQQTIKVSDTVAVVFSDITRPMPNDRVLPVLLAELEAVGVPDQNIYLINALGTHRAQTDTELDQMLGQDITGRYRMVQHNAWSTDLVEVGCNSCGRQVRVNRDYMQASKRILTGFVEPHFFAGFSGGPKAVLPGIADIESIMDNHGAQLLSHPRATWAVTAGNPLWEEIRAIAAASNPTFLLNVTLNKNRGITGVFAGDLQAAHESAVAFVREKAMQPVDRLYDIVLTSNSGYPLDLNLYQAVKGMSAAAQIVKTGGDIIIAAECWDGLPSHGEYARLLHEASSVDQLLETITTPGFRCHDRWEAQIQAQIQKKARVHVFADGLSADELQKALVIPCQSIEATLAKLLSNHPNAQVAILPEGPQVVPYLA
ncbi:MAG: nickel-dependent lactate racemase [Anaerolineae bacterium]|nr:nickel-dependent lactate racemase [Anaerolineae bacterium]